MSHHQETNPSLETDIEKSKMELVDKDFESAIVNQYVSKDLK